MGAQTKETGEIILPLFKKTRMRLRITLSVTAVLFSFAACKGESKSSSASEEMEENVRNYFFLDDSVDVKVAVMDTLYTEDLDEMLGTIESNLNLIGQDLDTLSLMIDDQAYRKLAFEEKMDQAVLIGRNKWKDSLHSAETTLLDYKLKQAQLSSKREGFKQTNRVLLHLQRSVWANIAGYNIAVQYDLEGEPLNLELLMDANHVIVD